MEETQNFRVPKGREILWLFVTRLIVLFSEEEINFG